MKEDKSSPLILNNLNTKAWSSVFFSYRQPAVAAECFAIIDFLTFYNQVVDEVDVDGDDDGDVYGDGDGEVDGDDDGDVGGSILCKTIRFRDFRKLCAPWKSSKKGIIIQFPAHFRKEIEKRIRKK